MKKTEIARKKEKGILRILRKITEGKLFLKEEVVLVRFLSESIVFLIMSECEIDKFKMLLDRFAVNEYEVIYGGETLKKMYSDGEHIESGIAVCCRCNETDTVLIYIPSTRFLSEV